MEAAVPPGVAAAPKAEGEAGFKPELGFWSLTFLIVGSMIGSGIFVKPGSMLNHAGSVPLVMLAWAGGAVIALSGGLMFAELGAAFPKAGGQYAFVRDGLGRLPAFLFSWTGFTVVQTGTFAAVAVVLANSAARAVHGLGGRLPGDSIPLSTRCLGDFTPSLTDPLGGRCQGFAVPAWDIGAIAVAVVVLLTVVNYFGVRRAAFLNNLSTVAKVGALALIMLLALFASDAGNFTGGGSLADGAPRFTFAGFSVALVASLFAYDGFAQATFVAAEVKDARRVLPRAIMTAGLGVAAIYLLATGAYFHALPANQVTAAELAGDDPIAASAVANIFGDPGLSAGIAVAVAVAIIVSTFGTTNAYILSSPRIYHSVAQDGEFPRAFGVLSRFRTPTFGLWYGAVWGGILVLTGGFETLSELVVFGLYVFYLLTVVAYFVLRRRQPEAFGAFRLRLGPVPALVFGLGSLYVLWTYLQADIPAVASMDSPLDILTNTTLFGLLLIASGLVVHAFMRRARRAARSPGEAA